MAHSWKFFKAGGFAQVRLDTGADIAAIGELDQKLWVALASPTKGLEIDPHTLELLDTDKDGRVRASEVITAAKWAASMLKNPNELVRGTAELSLDAINTGTDEGAKLLASARALLKTLGKGDATKISPADVAETAKIFAVALFNGDGVVPPLSAEKDEVTAQALRDIIACVGPVKDLSGQDGVDQAKLDQFHKEADAYLAWSAKGDPTSDPASFDAYKAVKAKVDDFFARCALAAMDPVAGPALNPPATDYGALANTEISAATPKVASLPLAKIEANRSLPLKAGLNPAWADAIAKLDATCVKPALGDKAELTLAEWRALGVKLAAREAWASTKPAGTVEKLTKARIQELTSGPTRAAIDALMAKDKTLENELKGITSVDKLTHYHRDLAAFLNNFVAFKDFYTHKSKAMFLAGTLYLDARSCDLCLWVDDAAKHATLGANSMAYLAYCDVVRKGTNEKAQIVAAFTSGDSDFLTVGRNGIFYDRKGRDWDATIVKIVEQPISVRQAFWSPYKRVAKFVEDQINAFAAAKDKEADAGLTGAVTATATKAPPPAFDIGKFAGVFAAIGLAVGMIGSAIAAVAVGFLGLKIWQMPLAIAGALLVVSGPSMLLAAMKLRKRSLAPLLDASGWAVNARARINIPFGTSLTHLPALPKGSEVAMTDPYAEKKPMWPWVLAVVVALGGLGFWQREWLMALWEQLMGR